MDDVWSDRRKDGKLILLAKKFPKRVPVLADEVHSMGFKLGIYSDTDLNTCAGFGDF